MRLVGPSVPATKRGLFGVSRVASSTACLAIFADSQNPQTVPELSVIQYDMGIGGGNEDCILIPADYELSADYMSLELEITGVQIDWPYTSSGKFTGNN